MGDIGYDGPQGPRGNDGLKGDKGLRGEPGLTVCKIFHNSHNFT